MTNNNTELEELLLEHGLLKADQLEHVRQRAAEQQKSIEEVIREEQLVYPEPMAQLKAQAVGLPYVDLQSAQIDAQAMQGVSNRAAVTYGFIAFGNQGGKLQVAMSTPEELHALEAVRFIVRKKGLSLELYCASPDSIEAALKPSNQEKIDQKVRDFNSELGQISQVPQKEEELQVALEEAPVNKIFAVIMRHAIEGLATDIHIEPFGSEMRVRYRINGQLHTSLLLPLASHKALVSRVKVLANMQINLSQVSQESRFTFHSNQQAYSVRVATIPTIYGEKVTLHLVDTTKITPSFTELGLIGVQQEALKEFLRNPKGLVIVGGPDGSGKSTTLNAILASLNHPTTSIATVEETIEYEMLGITQTQIAPGSDVTFERILQNLLRQDVEIIMVEEIRNQKTAHLLTKGALAGRLMLSTIHAKDAMHVIPQLVDMGVSPYVLSSSVRLVMSQRLVPKLCQSCKKAVVIPKMVKEEVQKQLQGISHAYLKSYDISTKLNFYQSIGCPVCHERKTRGQIAIFEVIPITKDFAGAIAEGGDYETLAQLIRDKNLLTLRQDGLLKALQGLVQYEDVVRVTS